MGGVQFMHKFSHHDWKRGVTELKVKADMEYGHQQGYSGAINSCDNISLHVPSKTFATNKQLLDYIEERFNKPLTNGDGEVIKLGLTGYSITKPIVMEFQGNLQIDFRNFAHVKEPALLLNPNGSIRAQGTLAEMKEKAKQLVRREQFDKDYYIVGKRTKKVYVATGERTFVKSTTKKSDANTYVLPCYEYVVYGWARS